MSSYDSTEFESTSRCCFSYASWVRQERRSMHATSKGVLLASVGRGSDFPRKIRLQKTFDCGRGPLNNWSQQEASRIDCADFNTRDTRSGPGGSTPALLACCGIVKMDSWMCIEELRAWRLAPRRGGNYERKKWRSRMLEKFARAQHRTRVKGSRVCSRAATPSRDAHDNSGGSRRMGLYVDVELLAPGRQRLLARRCHRCRDLSSCD